MRGEDESFVFDTIKCRTGHCGWVEVVGIVVNLVEVVEGVIVVDVEHVRFVSEGAHWCP